MYAVQEPWDTSCWYQQFHYNCNTRQENLWHTLYSFWYPICSQLWTSILICITFLFLFLRTTFYSSYIIDHIYSLGIAKYVSFWDIFKPLVQSLWYFHRNMTIFLYMYVHSSLYESTFIIPVLYERQRDGTYLKNPSPSVFSWRKRLIIKQLPRNKVKGVYCSI